MAGLNMQRWVIGGVLSLSVTVAVGWWLADSQPRGDAANFVLDQPLEQLLAVTFSHRLQSCQESMPEGADPWAPGSCVDTAYAASEGAFREAIPAAVQEQARQRSTELDQAWHDTAQNQALARKARHCFTAHYVDGGDDPEEVADRHAGQLVGAPQGVGYIEYTQLGDPDVTVLTKAQQQEVDALAKAAQETLDQCHAEYQAAFETHLLARDRQLLDEFAELREATQALIKPHP